MFCDIKDTLKPSLDAEDENIIDTSEEEDIDSPFSGRVLSVKDGVAFVTAYTMFELVKWSNSFLKIYKEWHLILKTIKWMYYFWR